MYIYKTTCLINGKIYIGQCNKAVQSSKWYLGSGVKIKDCLRRYGKDCFTKEILRICSNQRELDIWEMVYISKFQSRNPNIGYNILSGANEFGRENPMHIEANKRKVSERQKKFFKTKAGQENLNKMKNALIGNKFNVGRQISEETRTKLRNKRIAFYEQKKPASLLLS